MKIHVISDLHIDRNPYQIPADLEYDVLVVAGDVSETPTQAMEYLRSIGKPVVVVLGNHDYWSDFEAADMLDRIDEWKRLAKGSKVHVLERNSLVLDAGGARVRFLGGTLWTAYGNGNPHLMRMADNIMNDGHYMNAKRWVDSSKVLSKRYNRWRKDIYGFDPAGTVASFCAPIGLEIHQRTVAWLDRELRKKGNWDRTVVITHHMPSWDVMFDIGAVRNSDHTLKEDYWKRNVYRPDRCDSYVWRLAAYGSPMESFIQDHHKTIDCWVSGHLHDRFDVLKNGVRLVCNPRGNYRGHDSHDPRKLIDLKPGMSGSMTNLMDSIRPEIQKTCAQLTELADKMAALAPNLETGNQVVNDALVETFNIACSDFSEVAKPVCALISAVSSNFGCLFNAPGMHLWPPDMDFVLDGIKEQGEKSVRSARAFIHRLRRADRLPAKMLRQQERLIAETVAELTARGYTIADVVRDSGRLLSMHTRIVINERIDDTGWIDKMRHSGYSIFVMTKEGDDNVTTAL